MSAGRSVVASPVRKEVGEAARETGPAVHLGEQVGDAEARHRRVEPSAQGLGAVALLAADRRDLQPGLGQRSVHEVARGGRGEHDLQLLAQHAAARLEPSRGGIGQREAEPLLGAQGGEGGRCQQVILEGSYRVSGWSAQG
jgi:hypothetical protein